MQDSTSKFAIGTHRPIYLWAGPGTIRMNRLKFMEAPVDESVHQEAHTLVGAARVAQEIKCNWAYLMYDWGFPPEIEREDWEAFQQVVPVYKTAGIHTFGYIQTSNYVASGSYKGKDWYAVNPKGNPFYYYTGRLMACWQHPEWQDHLKMMVWGIVSSGADGVFFDNPWYGIQPLYNGTAWVGSAGCYCERCRAAFQEATGLEIPTPIDPEHDKTSQVYLKWRAEQVTQSITALANYARSLNPDIVVSVNDFDAVMRPSFVAYGIDLAQLAHTQDVMMIEDFGLPKWEPESEQTETKLVNNALTIRTARALIGDTPLSTNPYDKGIGFDEVYKPRRFQQAIAEAAACGASMVIKGTEYIESDGTFTLLTAPSYTSQREAIGTIHRWLSDYAELYTDRDNAATVGLLYPGEALWQSWGHIAARYFGAGQTLLCHNIPWRVVTSADNLNSLKTLLHFTPLPDKLTLPKHVNTINVSELPGWTQAKDSHLAKHPGIRSIYAYFANLLYRAYFEKRWARDIIDRTGIVQQHFIQSPFFKLPPHELKVSLLEAIGQPDFPHVTASIPVLVEHWQQGERWQLHLVNYSQTPQPITVTFDHAIKGQVLSPTSAPETFQGEKFEGTLDLYTVLSYT